MSSSSQNFDFTHEHDKGISVVTFCGHERGLNDPEQVDCILASICEIVDSGVERLILDFRNVAYFGSEFLNSLIVLRKKMASQKSFQPYQNRNYEYFQISPDRQTAIEVIAEPESDPLILCSVHRHCRDCFRVC